MRRRVTRKRSFVKALSYRLVIICLDFIALYWMTGAIHIAIGFMILSNLYTTIVYVLNERAWARTQWGIDPQA